MSQSGDGAERESERERERDREEGRGPKGAGHKVNCVPNHCQMVDIKAENLFNNSN